MDLGGESQAAARQDRRPHHQVVGEGGVDPPYGGRDVADRGDVRLDIALDLAVAQLVEDPGLESLVGVLDIERQEPADIRQIRGHRPRSGELPKPLDLELAALPAPHRLHPFQTGRVGVLAEQMDLVTEAG